MPWWQKVCAYQIYPRSFMDSNGDGIGDIPGIISRLDYLADLGIGMIWLSPVYRSPMRDNGYDIADYRDIAPEFGTLADMDRLIAEAQARRIGIVMDLVVNHTSDRHRWFEAARSSRDAPTRDYYIWRDPAPGGGPPSGIQSFFGGPAWTHCPETDQYYFHLFTPEQPDLNWRNPRLRAEIHDMMRWWVARGIAGFRMDVIDLIGKDVDRALIAEGPHLWTYLDEMHREVLAGTDLVTIGESWHASLETGPRYVAPKGLLSMIFQFNHIVAGWGEGRNKWAPAPFDPRVLKQALFAWQALFDEEGWNAIFLGNHDLPRMVSAFGDGSPAAAKALAAVLLTLRGTPFIYQGDEIGTPNAGFGSAAQYRDVETLNMLADAPDAKSGLAAAEVGSRDNARTPMRWSDKGGFSQAPPWIGFSAATASVESQEADSGSVLSFYKRLLALRNGTEALQTGRFEALLDDHPTVLAFRRIGGGQTVSIAVNLAGTSAELPVAVLSGGSLLLNTHEDINPQCLLPYQAVIIACHDC